MAKLKDRIEAELDNIQEVLNRLPSVTKLSSIKDLELAGVATLLHNFYNGVENQADYQFKRCEYTPGAKMAQ